MKRASTIRVLTVLCLLVVSAAAVLPAFLGGGDLSAPPKVMDLAGQGYRSPFDLAYGGTTLAVSDRTMGELVLIDSPAAQRHVKLQGQPTGLAWSGDGKSVLVSQFGAGSVAQVEAQSGKVVRELPVGPYPMGVAVAPRKNLLVVAESGNDRLAVIDLATGQLKAAVAVGHSPRHVAVTSDEKLAVVTNLLPIGDASKGDFASSVSLVDLGELTARTIQLRSGSVNVRGVKVSPDGRWAYIVHTLGKFMLPATQLDRGWINTNAMTIIDLQAGKPYATVLLDLLSEGAADPWGLAIAKDGSTLWVALSGAAGRAHRPQTAAPAAGGQAAQARRQQQVRHPCRPGTGQAARPAGTLQELRRAEHLGGHRRRPQQAPAIGVRPDGASRGRADDASARRRRQRSARH